MTNPGDLTQLNRAKSNPRDRLQLNRVKWAAHRNMADTKNRSSRRDLCNPYMVRGSNKARAVHPTQQLNLLNRSTLLLTKEINRDTTNPGDQIQVNRVNRAKSNLGVRLQLNRAKCNPGIRLQVSQDKLNRGDRLQINQPKWVLAAHSEFLLSPVTVYNLNLNPNSNSKVLNLSILHLTKEISRGMTKIYDPIQHNQALL